MFLSNLVVPPTPPSFVKLYREQGFGDPWSEDNSQPINDHVPELM